MGIEHVSWALKRVHGVDPAAKLILISLANYADEDGECWPSIATLCTETGLSEATVKRHCRQLRDAGAFTQEQRVTPGGRTKSNLFTLDLSWPGMPVATEGDVTDGAHGEPHEGVHGDPHGGHGEPHRGVMVTPPLTLNHQSDPSGKEEEEARALEADFQKLILAFEPGPTESLERGRKALRALGADDVALAVKHAPGFVRAMRAEGRRPPSIATYVAERRWEAVARVAAKSKTELGGGKVFVIKGSDAWKAWARHRNANPDTMISALSRERNQHGWWFQTLYPPRQGEVRQGETISGEDL